MSIPLEKNHTSFSASQATPSSILDSPESSQSSCDLADGQPSLPSDFCLPARLKLQRVLVAAASSTCVVTLVTDRTRNCDFILKSSIHSLETEFKLQSSLNNPHVAKAYEHFHACGRYHILIEYCESLDLFNYAQDRDLSEVQAKRYFRQLMEAVSHCHRAKIAHLDIKPENCFLDACDNLKLGDFGAAKSIREGVKLRSMRGTLEYMSPQQHRSLPFDAYKADIFAAGKLLFELALNFTPFHIASSKDPNYELFVKDTQTYWRIKRNAMQGKGQDGEWSGELKDLIEKMMHPDESCRLNAEEVLRHSWLA